MEGAPTRFDDLSETEVSDQGGLSSVELQLQ